MNILDVKNLNVSFPGKNGIIKASQDISFSIREGEICVLVGETGSGKSVIGSAILHLLPKSAEVSGLVLYQGRETLSMNEAAFSKLRGHEIALIPQNPTGSLSPLMKCGKQIGEVYENRSLEKSEILARVNQMLSLLKFSDPKRISESYPYELSGGMRQRLVTGIALAEKPRLLIADEPTKGLDYEARKMTMDLLLSLKNRTQNSILMITHDLEVAKTIGDTIGVLYSGELVEFGSSHEIFENPGHPYTKGLIAALPKNGLHPMPGICPGLSSLPKGCYFHDRCPNPCEESVACHPKLKEISGRAVRCSRFCA